MPYAGQFKRLTCAYSWDRLSST